MRLRRIKRYTPDGLLAHEARSFSWAECTLVAQAQCRPGITLIVYDVVSDDGFEGNPRVERRIAVAHQTHIMWSSILGQGEYVWDKYG